MIPERLNLPGQLACYFVESRLTVLLAVAILAFGVIGLLFTPREENPQIIVPAAEVRVNLPGALPGEVEHTLLAPLEAELLAIDGVKHVYGTALEGLARIDVEFEVGEDKEDAFVRLYDRVLRNRHRLPPNAGEPRIQAIDVDDVPVFTLTLASGHYDDADLRLMAERILERLRSVQGVGRGYVVGGRSREMRIEVSPERLQAYGVTLNQVADAVAAANVSQPLGLRVYTGKNRALRVVGLIEDATELADIVVHSAGGQLLRVRDIGNVVDGPPAEIVQMTRFAFGPADPRFGTGTLVEMAAVTVAIAKRNGVNAVKLTETLRTRVEQMRQLFIPPDVYAVVTRDDGIRADKTVTRLVEHLLIAIGAVTLVLLWFLGWRAAAIVAVTIPLVFAVVMGADLLAGPTLNRITLYALILALGMLVDDAIVVTENIHRHYLSLTSDKDNVDKADAAVLATHEIGNPTTLATITVVTVFLSLTLVTGMLGQYFYPITFNLPMAMIASLIIAYSVTPWLARRFMRTGRHCGRSGQSALQRTYYVLIKHLLAHRGLRIGFYILISVLLVLSLLQPAWQFIRPQGVAGAVSSLGVPLAFLPKDDKNTFLIHIHLPETTPLEVTDRAARKLGELLRRQSYVRDYQTHVGIPAIIDFNGQLKGSGRNLGPQFAEIRINLQDKFERRPTSIDYALALRPQIEAIAAGYPGGIIQLVEDPPGPPVRATVLAEIYGPDNERLATLAHRVVDAFKQTHDMAEVWASVPFEVAEYQIRVNREKSALSDVDPTQVTQAVARLLRGETLAQAHPVGTRTPVPVRLHIPREQRIDPTLLERAFVHNGAGQTVPLSEVTDMVMGIQPKPINHKDTERVEYVGGELAASAPAYAVLDLDLRLDELSLEGEGQLNTKNLSFIPIRPDALKGYQLLWEGEMRLTLDAFRDMGLALGLALLVIFLLLVAYYRSFSLPLLAMSAVPLALIGVFPGHWLLGTTFSAASMVGVIALAGVVVRNSLLLIDFAQEYQRQGHPIEEAVREAGAVRLRPILLTTLAIALGTAIMVPDPVMGGLAIALIFGSMSSALFVVFVVPLLYRHWMS
ncbi:efflux RND transporter permease subunit [Sedimenticola selenatireducens]|uniref:efflux RND transporter permease subunit n=1 Tax=Sedimenticola selenatireducens TaxID=191960 RepID=UPI000490DF79|nr:efflux RND transporter permease subunit [Sedimenticola selenatireducens]